MTGRLSFGRQVDDIVVVMSPVVAIVISVLLVRSRLMASNRRREDTEV